MPTRRKSPEVKNTPPRRMTAPRREIELKGVSARYYDFLVMAGTLGAYQRLIEDVVETMGIRPGDRILDMGAGTGKNALLMLPYVGDGGSITALEIGEEMRAQFARKCAKLPNVSLLDMRIEEPLPFAEEFETVFLSFVLHGFEPVTADAIVANAHRALKPGGNLFILDWNRMDLDKESSLFRAFIRHIECDRARDFIRWDMKVFLGAHLFGGFREKLYYKNRIRLLMAVKQNP